MIQKSYILNKKHVVCRRKATGVLQSGLETIIALSTTPQTTSDSGENEAEALPALTPTAVTTIVEDMAVSLGKFS